MTTAEIILNYATKHEGVFQRKDLLRDIVSKQSGITERAVDLQITRLVASGKLTRKTRGKYQLTACTYPEFVVCLSEMEIGIYQKLKMQFPLLDFCIWSPRVLTSFMLHIPDIGYTFVDVEKEGMEPVFHALQDMNLGRNIFLAPSAEECERYLTGTDAIVVRQLIGQSPIMEVDGCVVPRIEKILVDAVGDNELYYASGSEIYFIFEDACKSIHVNMSKLKRYASRRNRKAQVEKILNDIGHD